MPSSYFNKEAYPDLYSQYENVSVDINAPNLFAPSEAGESFNLGVDLFESNRTIKGVEPPSGIENDGKSPIEPGTKTQNGLSPGTAEAWGAGITAINLLSKMIRDHKNQPTTKPLGKNAVKEARNRAVSKYLNPKKKKKKKYFA